MPVNMVEVENLSKLYKLGSLGTGTLSHDLNRWWWRMSGKGDPYEIKATKNDRKSGGSQDYVWSLNNLNFSIQQGDVLGIIGSNGAGKSTLLKILSKITKPTKGVIKLNGKVASLLEVGTGFHPELTGRENVFLNGAILGMRKQEIKNRFDEIIDFSGIGRYIDTPVKKYSSGMYVRLAFAVAAHLEPDILIIDEVLAVGDAEFQAKCLGKMKDVSTNQGRTVIFVSHSTAAIKQLCNKGILLEYGAQKITGNIDEVIALYQHEEADVAAGKRGKLPDAAQGYFTDWKLEETSAFNEHSCYTGDTCVFSFGFRALENLKNCEVRFKIQYNHLMILHASSLTNKSGNFSIEAGFYRFKFKVDLPLRDAKFDIEAVFLSFSNIVDTWASSTKLTIMDNFESKVHTGVINPAIEFFVEDKVPETIG
jgi:lipopolysaccharide transport system ATP-binding protein